jgi:hypothetical protein
VEAALLNPTYGTSDGTIATADVANNAGNRSGMGDIEARAGFTLKPIAGVGGTIGVSYLTGTRTYGATVGGTTTDIDASAFGVDAVTPDPVRRIAASTSAARAWTAPTPASPPPHQRTKGVKSSATGLSHHQALPGPLRAGRPGPGDDDGSLPAATATSTQRLENAMVHAGLLINMNKAWRVGLEWEQTTTKARAGTAANVNATSELSGSQLSLSTQLRF